MSAPHTSIALGLNGRELGREVARQLLAAQRGRRTPVRLQDAVVVARAVDLGASEIQRMAGCSRQTVYSLAAAERHDLAPPQVDLEIVICVAGTGGTISVAELADRLRIDLAECVAETNRVVAQGLLRADRPGGVLPATALVATDDGAEVLRGHLDDLLLSRADSTSVFLHIDDSETAALSAAAADILSGHEHDILDITVAPSMMTGPELAFAVHTSSTRRAIDVTVDVWNALRDAAGLPATHARIASVIPPAAPPAAPSEVLDAFVVGITEAAPLTHAKVELARARFAGDANEKVLAMRCLTSAATVLRRLVQRETPARPITDSEAAFYEWAFVRDLRLETDTAKVQAPLADALDLACERLGPLPGGRLAPLRAPDGIPTVARAVTPTPTELCHIAQLAGRAIGAARTIGSIDVAAEVLAVALGVAPDPPA